MLRVTKVMVTLAFVISAAGCATTVSPLSRSTQIDGKPAVEQVLRVEEPFAFKPSFFAMNFPAGDYIPQFEDDKAIYFRAVNQITGRSVSGGRTFQGGVSISKSASKDMNVWTDDAGDLTRFQLTERPRFSLRSKQSLKPVE